MAATHRTERGMGRGKKKVRVLSDSEKRKLVKEWLEQSPSEDKMTMAEYDKGKKRSKARNKVKKMEERERKKKFKNKMEEKDIHLLKTPEV